MTDKSPRDSAELEGANMEMLLAAAIECSKKQQAMLSGEVSKDDAWVTEFETVESVRSRIVRQLDWQDREWLLANRDGLLLLQRMDEENRLRLQELRDELAVSLSRLRLKRGVAAEYLRFQVPDGQ